MTATKIPYLTKTWNFQTGCNHWKNPQICPVGPECFAKCNYARFLRDYTPTLHPEKLLEPLSWKTPQRVGVCFTGDLMGEWVDPEMNAGLWGFNDDGSDLSKLSLKKAVDYVINSCPQHQFFFLTKNPAGYAKWGTWPDNAWLGATACNLLSYYKAREELEKADAKYKWLSFEPLMESMGLPGENFLKGIDWVVIGGWSTAAQRKKHPIDINWIREIVEAADKAGIPVYLKENLYDLLYRNQGGFSCIEEWAHPKGSPFELRQELPEAVK